MEHCNCLVYSREPSIHCNSFTRRFFKNASSTSWNRRTRVRVSVDLKKRINKYRCNTAAAAVMVLPGLLDFSPRFSAGASFKCFCSNKENSLFEDFSVLSPNTEWDYGSIWSSMSLYFFSLHIPLSFGGLSMIAEIMHQRFLDPQTEAISILLIQSIELWGTLALLRYTLKLDYKLPTIFHGSNASNGRSWVQAFVLGFGLLMLLVLLTSFLAERLIGPKDVNNPMLKEILLSGSISKATCFLTYCIVTPFLEEIVYRGFLLGSLASTMKWHHAVIISSCIFSGAHLSSENFLQLFIIGCILGCSYCWSGNLASSFFIHSLYNAVILLLTFVS